MTNHPRAALARSTALRVSALAAPPVLVGLDASKCFAASASASAPRQPSSRSCSATRQFGDGIEDNGLRGNFTWSF